MAGIKITDLPAAPSAQLTDVFPVDQLPGPVTYKESNSQLLSLFQANGAALTRTNDTNVTMTLGGSPNSALLNAASITMGWSGQLSPTRGGTGINNAASTLTLGGSLATSGAFSSTFTMTGATTVTFPTTGTLATTSQIPTVTPAALTKVDDTNVTLTLGGTPTTALLQATSITAGWSGTLSGARGGTGVNNGANTATYAGNLNFASSFTTSGAFAVTQTYTGVTNVTFPTSGTLATTTQLPTPAALTKTDDTNVTLTLGGTPTTALLQATSITAGWTGQLGLTRGGTAASLTASNGGIVYSNASTLAILAGTATAGQIIRSGASTTPSWSTATYPATAGTSGNVLTSDGTNWISSAPAASGVTSITGTASQVIASASTGAVTLSLPQSIATTSAVTFGSVTFSPTTQGIVGTATNNSASTGYVGEFVSSVVLSGSPVTLTSNVAADITSISLTAGDWDLSGLSYIFVGSGTLFIGWTSLTSATLPDGSLRNTLVLGAAVAQWGCPTPLMRISIASTTTVYLSAFSTFTIGPGAASGAIYARRVR